MRWLFAAVWISCGGAPAPAPGPATAPTTESESESADADADADAVAGARAAAGPGAPPINAIPEIEARVILAKMFRDAGFRIVYDVPIALGAATVAIDGFDPEAQIGFEYRAPEEQAAWSGAIPADAKVKVLVIGPTDRDTVEQRGKAFLATVVQPEK